MSGVNELVQTFVTEYKKTPAKLKVCLDLSSALNDLHSQQQAQPPLSVAQVLDAFMVYALLTAAVQVRQQPQQMLILLTSCAAA
jgi:hypothetical protein